jgi:hypothetical protein
MTRKTTSLGLISTALLCSGSLWAQAADSASDASRNDAERDDPEEVIVRGRRLSDFRFALEAARVRVYDVFNDLNSDDAFDVRCQYEASTGTRMPQHICRPRFKDDISNAAARAYTSTLKDRCPGGLTQACIFSPYSSQAIANAQAAESPCAVMQKRFAVEMARVVAEHPELQQAILDYEAVERAYDEARGGQRARGCDRPEPPPRCSR